VVDPDSPSLRILRATRGCGGTQVLVGGDSAAFADPTLALASLLGEREAGGERIPAVTLLVRRAEQIWIPPAIEWLRARGRAVALRTAVVLPRSVVDRLRGGDVPVALELAHARAGVQRALLGASAASASALLLQAQHLAAIGVPVSADLSPLLPGIHDQPDGFDPLVRHVVAADLRRARLVVGRLTSARLSALATVLAPGALLALGRAFGLSPEVLRAPAPARRAWRLEARVADGLRAGLRRRALDAGLLVDGATCGCGCGSPAISGGGRYVPVGQPQLFADTAV
jgi:hypothetical protein